MSNCARTIRKKRQSLSQVGEYCRKSDVSRVFISDRSLKFKLHSREFQHQHRCNRLPMEELFRRVTRHFLSYIDVHTSTHIHIGVNSEVYINPEQRLVNEANSFNYKNAKINPYSMCLSYILQIYYAKRVM